MAYQDTPETDALFQQLYGNLIGHQDTLGLGGANQYMYDPSQGLGYGHGSMQTSDPGRLQQPLTPSYYNEGFDWMQALGGVGGGAVVGGGLGGLIGGRLPLGQVADTSDIDKQVQDLQKQLNNHYKTRDSRAKKGKTPHKRNINSIATKESELEKLSKEQNVLKKRGRVGKRLGRIGRGAKAGGITTALLSGLLNLYNQQKSMNANSRIGGAISSMPAQRYDQLSPLMYPE